MFSFFIEESAARVWTGMEWGGDRGRLRKGGFWSAGRVEPHPKTQGDADMLVGGGGD